MHHLHIDRFAGLESGIHSLDPRAKLVTTLAFVLLVVLTPDGRYASFAIYAALILTVILVSHVPVMYIIKRSLVILPFVLFVSVFVPFITPGREVASLNIGPVEASLTNEGIIRFVSIAVRASIAFFATITLVSTTRFGDLMRAAGALGLPSKLVIVLSFMYRYLFVLVDEVSHMMLARTLRSHGRGGIIVLKASGGIVGALLVRSFEHAERLYEAMMLRGYSGRPHTIRPMKIVARDVEFCLIFVFLSCAGWIAGILF